VGVVVEGRGGAEVDTVEPAVSEAEACPRCRAVDCGTLVSGGRQQLALGRSASFRQSLSEMLPAPGGLWLSDAAGERYVCELRCIAVDAQSWSAGSGPR
jgi:hypothetical protein